MERIVRRQKQWAVRWPRGSGRAGTEQNVGA